MLAAFHGEEVVGTVQVVLADGDGGTSNSVSTTVTVTPVNDAPAVTTNTGLTLNEGAEAFISPTVLSATDPDNTAAQVTFSVTSGPAHGTLLLSGNPTTAFTQANLDAGLVSYRHDG